MRAFDYAAPKSLKEAVALLSQKGDRARVLSGGTDLIVQVREKRRDLDLMVDVKRIPELLEIRYDATSGLTLGASVACNRIYEHPVISRTYPGTGGRGFPDRWNTDSEPGFAGGKSLQRVSGGRLHSGVDCSPRNLRDCRTEGRTRAAC